MKRKTSKVLSIVLSLAMVITMIPAFSISASAGTDSPDLVKVIQDSLGYEYSPAYNYASNDTVIVSNDSYKILLSSYSSSASSSDKWCDLQYFLGALKKSNSIEYVQYNQTNYSWSDTWNEGVNKWLDASSNPLSSIITEDSIENGSDEWIIGVSSDNSEYYNLTVKYIDNSYTALQYALNNSYENDTITLVSDRTENISIDTSKKITLDLNGYVLKAQKAGSVITNKGNLTIKDSGSDKTHYFMVNSSDCWVLDDTLKTDDYTFSSTNGLKKNSTATSDIPSDGDVIKCYGGCITGGSAVDEDSCYCGGGIDNEGTLTLYSGNIIGNNAGYGGGIRVYGETTMAGGAIVGNTSQQTGAGLHVTANCEFILNNGIIGYNSVNNPIEGGGGLFISGKFTMNGGTVIGNKAKSGAGVYVYYYDKSTTPGVFTMNAGTIKNNSATDKGGGVYVDDNPSVLLCGTITDNTAVKMGGGVCCNAPVTIGGSVNITGNSCVKNYVSTENNVTLRGGDKTGVINISNIEATEPTSQAKVGVNITSESDGTFTDGKFTDNGEAGDKQLFVSDSNSYYVNYNTDHFELVEATVKIDDNIENGMVSVSNQSAGAGTTVTVTATPDTDYVLTKITVTDNNGKSISVNKNQFTMPEASRLPVTVSATFTPIDYYTVKINSSIKYGSVTSDVAKAEEGDKVTLTVKPSTGYALEDLTVIYNTNKTATLNEVSDTEYTFKMPAYDVTVKATFAKLYGITVNDATGGTVKSDVSKAIEGDKVTLTVTPDSDYELNSISVVDSNKKSVELTKVNSTTYTFTMPESSVTVKSSFNEVVEPVVNRFVDVNETDYFYDAVLWADDKDITSGKDYSHFAPYDVCTRAQVVTFLWRAAGSPAPTSAANPFTDISKSDYYYNAVLWAVQNGITKGTTDTTFTPDANVKRCEAVTFLARMKGVKDTATGYSHKFSDVYSTDYYNNAVAWAATNKITEGKTTTIFAPKENCLRCEIVTFLYRCFN